MRQHRSFMVVAPILCTLAVAQETAEPRPVETIRAEAERLTPLVSSELAKQFLDATADLPEIEGERVVWWNRAERKSLRPEQAETMTAEQLEGYQERRFGEAFYYNTAYGTPLAYVRALDLAAAAGFESADGTRVFDFGFGSIGQLRLLASLGANAVGVEVLELLRDFYREPSDTGTIARSSVAGPGSPGSVTLRYGRFPGDDELRRVVGGGYDLFISKNVLKKGYVHPEREADPSRLVHLGVDDETFVKAVFDMLDPGGLAVIYNLYPAQNPPDEPYLPHATGGCPFDRQLVEAVGFEVVAFDRDDTDEVRRLAETLGWGDHMDLGNDLFAMYTILQRP